MWTGSRVSSLSPTSCNCRLKLKALQGHVIQLHNNAVVADIQLGSCSQLSYERLLHSVSPVGLLTVLRASFNSP